MTPEQAHFLLHDVYLPQLENEQKTTRRLIEAMPADQGHYTPHETSMPAMKLAKHIVSAEAFFLNGISTGNFDRAAGAIPESVTTPVELLVWYNEHFGAGMEKLKAMSDEDLAKPIQFAIFNLPAVRFAGFVINHSVHHRGQLSTSPASDGLQSSRHLRRQRG